MINANELRIGNWYQSKDEIKSKLKVRDGKDIDDILKWQNYEPIPITPEILEKCGFIKSHSKYLLKATDFFTISFDSGWFNLYDPNFNLDHGVLISDKNYLHQLQNLYFALTGTELEIKSFSNFEAV